MSPSPLLLLLLLLLHESTGSWLLVRLLLAEANEGLLVAGLGETSREGGRSVRKSTRLC